MKYVLDSSAALPWVLPEKDSAKAIQLRNDARNAVHELLAARPQTDGAAPANELRANAIPFPFRLPLRDIAERRRVVLERVREKKRIRMMRDRGRGEAPAIAPATVTTWPPPGAKF